MGMNSLQYIISKLIESVILFLGSFMGKGIIELPPAVVWAAVKDSRTRFSYDNMLKVKFVAVFVHLSGVHLFVAHVLSVMLLLLFWRSIALHVVFLQEIRKK